MKNLYLVPHDFTEIGDIALNYAINLGKKVKTEIQLVHIVNDKKKLVAGKQKLEQIIEEKKKSENLSGIELTSNIVLGNIFEDIGRVAKKEGAQLIIMGTHGVLGMQKIFGSNAIKVVTSSDVPFLVVQKNSTIEEVKKIVVPIDMTKESLQITNIAGDLAKIFSAEVHIIAEKETDQILSRTQISRIAMLKDQFADRNVNTIVSLIESSGTYHNKILNYSKENNINFIAIAYHSEKILSFLDNFAQNLLVNELNLPCLIINSQSVSKLYF